MKELFFKKWNSSRNQFITSQILHGDNDQINQVSVYGENIFLSVDQVFYQVSKKDLSNHQNIGLEELNDILEIMDEQELTVMIRKAWIKEQSSQLFLHNLKDAISQLTPIKVYPQSSHEWFSEFEDTFQDIFTEADFDVINHIPLTQPEEESDNEWITQNETRTYQIAGLSRMLIIIMMFSFNNLFANSVRGELLMSINDNEVSKHINKIYDDAEIVCKKYNIPIGILLAKSIVENFQKKSCLNDSEFNYLGIMAEGGCMKFNSRIHCFEFWAKIISKDCHQELKFKTLNGWIYALSCNGSLQSRSYRAKIRRVIKRYNLSITTK
jgi:hypothetical protein